MTYTTTSSSKRERVYTGVKQAKRLEEIKDEIQNAFSYFERNYKRYQEFMRFVFVSTLTTTEMTKLAALKKPPLQFNILESIISRQRGEFMNHEPSVSVKAAYGVDITKMPEDFIKMMEILEAHLRELLTSTCNDQIQYKCYTDLLAGGFSAIEIYTDYISSMSFEQNIYIERCHNPCLVGFDPKARLTHKGDGRFAFKIIPMEKFEVAKRWGDKVAENIKFMQTDNFEGFKWSYKNGVKEIALIAEFFEKITKDKTIVKLADTDVFRNEQMIQALKNNGVELKNVMEKDAYDEMIQVFIMLFPYNIPPVIVQERRACFETIEKTILCESQILSHDVTDFEHLPLVFIDGNSVEVQLYDSVGYEQVTRPMVYHAKGIQKLKDFAGQTQAAEIENMMQSKLMAAVESMPDEPDYQAAYKNYQQASTIMYKSFKDSNPDMPLPQPREIQRTPTPTIVGETFMLSDKLVQNILGTYDAELGIQGNDLSGKAIRQGALQSSAATAPYMMGYIQGWSWICQILINLIPKYYISPRTIPVIMPDGKRDYVMINNEQDPNSIMMHYDPKDLMVQVDFGASSNVQRQVAMETIMGLMKINGKINKFVSEEGAETLLSNIEFKGSDRFVAAFTQWDEKEKQNQQQQQQLMQQNQMLEMSEKQATINLTNSQAKANEALAQAKMADMMLKSKQQQDDKMLDTAEFLRDTENQSRELDQSAAKIAIAGQEANIDEVLAVAEIKESNINAILRAEEVAAERQRTVVDAAISVSEHKHKIRMDRHNMAQDMLKSTVKEE